MFTVRIKFNGLSVFKGPLFFISIPNWIRIFFAIVEFCAHVQFLSKCNFVLHLLPEESVSIHQLLDFLGYD